MFNLDDYEPVEKRLGYKKDAKSFSSLCSMPLIAKYAQPSM